MLQRALNRAVKWELVTRNVVLATDPPTSRARTITPLSEAEARRLLAAVAGHRLEALYRIALSLGLRRGEVLGLLWADIDFNKKTLRVSGALQRVQGKLERSEPKTRAGARTLLLPDVLVELLAEHQQRQAEERTFRGAEWKEHDLVFPAERGTPMEPSNLHRHFKLVLKRAGLPLTTRFHDLRHSCATFLMMRSVGAKRYRPGRPPSGGDGDPWPQPDQPDHEYLRPRAPRDPARCDDQGGRPVRQVEAGA